MSASIVFSVMGQDRIGIVDEVTRLLLDLGGNIEVSRMARLGGEFAILMLASLPEAKLPALEQSAARLAAQGYKLTTTRTDQTVAQRYANWRPYQIEVRGADHEGIIHVFAHSLSERGINIETLDTATARAPISGTPLFSMQATVLVPPRLSEADWEGDLHEVGHRENLEIKITATRP